MSLCIQDCGIMKPTLVQSQDVDEAFLPSLPTHLSSCQIGLFRGWAHTLCISENNIFLLVKADVVQVLHPAWRSPDVIIFLFSAFCCAQISAH